MEQILFEDYINYNIGNQGDAYSIITWVIKQISRGRFEISDNLCKVEILLHKKKRMVVLSNVIKISDLIKLTDVILTEPSVDFFRQKVSTIDEPLLICLKKYQDQFYRFGTEYKNEYWYKFYSHTEIDDEMRKLYQAGWIDYENQLDKESIIHDELGICGLWAMPYNTLLKCFNEECKNRYGDKLFILKTVPDCRYLCDDMEIIGDRFEVVEKYDLNAIYDIGKLINRLIGIETNKYEPIIKNNNTRIYNLISENMELSDKIKQSKLTQLLSFLIGILCGIITCYLI